MALRRAGDRSLAMHLGRSTDVAPGRMTDANLVCAQVDAKLFGRLRLLSLEVRVVAAKPKEPSPAVQHSTPAADGQNATQSRGLRDRDTGSELSRAVELWTLSSKVLDEIRAR